VLYHKNACKKALVGVTMPLKYIKERHARSTLLGKIAFGYMRRGFYDFAKGFYTNALNLDPNNTEARINLGLCLKKLEEQGR